MDNTTKNVNARLETLAQAILEKSEDVKADLEYVEDLLSAMPNYFSKVVMSETGIRLARFKYSEDPEAMRDAVQAIDASRRSAHEDMTMNLNILNRVAGIYGVPEIFELPKEELDFNDLEDREIAADMCYNFCRDTYLDSKSRDQLEKESIQTRAERGDELHKISEMGGYFREDENRFTSRYDGGDER